MAKQSKKTDIDTPSIKGEIGNNGKDPKTGRFVKGGPGGPGNPYYRKVAEFRSAMMSAVTQDDIKQVVQKMVKLAKEGEAWACKELLDRTLGKAVQQVDATVTTNELSPEEARKKIAGYFGLNEEELESKEPNE